MSEKEENVEAETPKEDIDEKEDEEAEETEAATEEAEEESREEEAEEKKEAKEEIVEERVYIVPLSRAWISPRKERVPKAVRILKIFIKRHMKPESIVLSEEVNERLWGRGIEKPPRRIRVRAVKDRDGKVSIHLAEGE